MFSQFCRACGNEIRTESHQPLEFCTNCGTKLPPQALNFTPNYSMAAQVQRARKANNRTTFWVLSAIAGVFVLTGVLGVGIMFLAAVRNRDERGAFPPPTPRSSPASSPKTTSSALLSFGKEGIGQGEFKNAGAAAIDREGNIYVGDGTFRIQKFDQTGKFLQLWNVTESTEKPDEKFSGGISEMVVDSKNRLYVAVKGKELLRYDGATGKFIDKIALYGEKWMNTVQEARILDMVMLNDDRVAIFANSFPRREYVIMVSPEGKPEIKHKELLTKQSNEPGGMMSGAMLVNVAGEMFLMNGITTGKKYIYRFKSDGSYVDRFTWDGAPEIGSFSNNLLALNSKGEIYAYNRDKSQLVVLNAEGVQQRAIPLKVGYFRKMLLDASDNIYIVSDGKIEKFPPAGI